MPVRAAWDTLGQTSGSAMNEKTERNPKRGAAWLIAAAAIVVSLSPMAGAHAQDGPARDGSAAAKQLNSSTSGNFFVLQIATTSPDQLKAEWQKKTATVSLTTTTHVTRHQPIVTFIIFKGCRGDASGNCNVTVDYHLVGPDGKTYGERKMAEVWVGHPPAPNLNLQISPSGFSVSFENGDPLGVYRLRAAITDHVAGVTLDTEQSLTVTKS